MRRVLAIFLSVLCIALPLRAVASVGTPDMPCPHMQGMDTDTGSEAQSQQHDCCNDAATAAQTGQLCKSGHDCSTPVAYVLPQPAMHLVIATERVQISVVTPHRLTDPPDAVWRPPALS